MTRQTKPPPRPDNLPLAVGVILLTVLALSFGDALIKLASGRFAIWQVFVVRSLIALPLLLAVLVATAPAALRLPVAPGWAVLRSLMLVAMWVAYYLALPELPLAAAAAAYYTLPIFVTLFSAVFLGDPVGRVGWLAVVLGFAGVLMILRPTAGDFNGFALLPLVSAMLYAGAMILTRTKCREEHPLVLAVVLNLAFVLVGGLVAALIAPLPEAAREGFLLAPWTAMGREEWAAMAVLAISIVIGSVGATVAYQSAPPAVVGIFDFAYVGFAAVWGMLLFSDVPDAASLVGIGLIVAAGILSLRR